MVAFDQVGRHAFSGRKDYYGLFGSDQVLLPLILMSKPQPLKVPATPSKSTEGDRDKTPIAIKQAGPSNGTIAPKDISSPHELTAFVSHNLETSFQDELTVNVGGNALGAIGFEV